jgi:hypothetical protein
VWDFSVDKIDKTLESWLRRNAAKNRGLFEDQPENVQDDAN